MELSDFYRDKILEHYRNPHHFGELQEATITQDEENFSCGDRILLMLQIDKNIIQQIQFQGAGCALCFASASILCDIMTQKYLAEAQKICYDVLLALRGENDPNILKNYGDMEGFMAVIANSNRIQCVILAWQGLQNILKKLV